MNNNSINAELSRYLEKRGSSNQIKKLSKLNFILDVVPFVSEIRGIARSIREKENIVEIRNTSSEVHVVEKRSFFKMISRKFSDLFMSKKTEDFDVPIEPKEDNPQNADSVKNTEKRGDIFKKDTFFKRPQDDSFHLLGWARKEDMKEKELIEVEEEPDNAVENAIDNLSSRDQAINKTFSEKEMNSLLKEDVSGFQKVVLYKPQLNDDMKNILSTTHKMIKTIPKPALEEFEKTDDYQKYMALLKRYGIEEK
jgi:hypothetical protein